MLNNSSRKAFVVHNPKAGKEEQVDQIRSTLARCFTPPRWSFETYETTGKDDVAAICRAACERGTSLVVSAGGDGTVVGVANGLVNGQVPLGILPLGTGNDLARALGVPLSLNEAMDLLVGDHDVAHVDALKVGDRFFFSNVSVGISPHMMNETSSEQKKRFGLLAYVWTTIKRSGIFKPHRFTLTIDGQPRRIRASEVLISSPTLLDKPPQPFGPPETLTDGQFEVYVVTAHTVWDFFRLVWGLLRHPGQSSAKLLHWTGSKSIRIESGRHRQLVQADGEVIGHTPLEIHLIPKALRVIVPKPTPGHKNVRMDTRPVLVSVASDKGSRTSPRKPSESGN